VYVYAHVCMDGWMDDWMDGYIYIIEPVYCKVGGGV
jgi:hypothetical protein